MSTVKHDESIEPVGCEKCKFTGSIEKRTGDRIEIELCSCAKAALEHNLCTEANLPVRHVNWTPAQLKANFADKNKIALQAIEQYIEDIHSNVFEGKGLLISAPVAAHKTELVIYLLRKALDAGYKSFFITANQLMENANRYDDEIAQKQLDYIRYEAHIVGIANIDPLGFQRNQQNYKTQFLGGIVSAVVESGRPLIVSASVTPDVIRKNVPDYIVEHFSTLTEVVFRSEGTKKEFTNGANAL